MSFQRRAGAVAAATCAVALACAVTAPAAPAAAKPKAEKLSKKKRAELRRKNAKQTQPNVVLINTDDMNVTDMFVMANTLNLLGAQGTTFSNSWVSYPLCCPSRATQLTGQYAHNHGVRTDQRYGDLDNTNTLAVWLRNAQYRTVMVGKYLNGYGVARPREVPPGWSQWFALTGGTEQKRYAFRLNENGKVRKYPRKKKNYVTDILSQKLNGTLKNWARSPKPFFAYFNPNAPHGERGTPPWSTRDPEPAPQDLGRIGNTPNPRYPNFNEDDVSDKPSAIQQLPTLSDAQLADLDRRYRGRIESLYSVDREVGRLVQLVRKAGDDGKTVFIFTSDNGLELGAHRIMFKDYLYTEGEAVPLIIRGPGFPAGVTRSQPVMNIDLAPTIASLAGAQPGRVQDGISLLPLAQDPTVAQNRDLLFESFDLGSFGIKQGPWMYNQYDNGDDELYNLDSDPYELQNVASKPGNAGLRTQLSQRLAQLKSCAGASCR